MVILGIIIVIVFILLLWLYNQKDKKRIQYILDKKKLGYSEVYIMYLEGSFEYGLLTENILRLYESQNYSNLDKINILNYKDQLREISLEDVHLIERR